MDEYMMADEAPEQQDGQYVEEAHEENDMDAENRLAKIKGWEAYRQRWLDHYQRKIAEVNDRADRNIAWHKFHLAQFFRSVPHKTTKTSVYYDGLPSCRLSMTMATDKINKPSREDLDKILLRLAEQGDKGMIKKTVTEEVDWAQYKANLAIVDGRVVDMRTGEFVDDVKITHVEPEFVLKFNKESMSMKEDENNEDHGNPNT